MKKDFKTNAGKRSSLRILMGNLVGFSQGGLMEGELAGSIVNGGNSVHGDQRARVGKEEEMDGGDQSFRGIEGLEQ